MVTTLAAVKGRLAGLAARRPGFALCLWGEAGIGKTHTATALLRECPVRHLALHIGVSQQDLARALPKPKKGVVWADGVLERVVAGENVETSTFSGAVVSVLTRLAPFVLHFEDVHEANAEQRVFVEDLAQTVSRSSGLALVVTGRTALPGPFETLRLAPLTALESQALLQAEAGVALPGEATAWIHDRAAGNPLFALGFFRHLARLGFLWNDGRHWRWREPQQHTLPTTVEALIAEVLDSVLSSNGSQRLVQALALLGPNVKTSVLAAVAGLEEKNLSALWQQLEQTGVLHGHDFAHPLYREVVLRDMPANKRQNLARATLRVFKDDPRKACIFLDAAALPHAESLVLIEQAIGVIPKNNLERALLHANAVACASGKAKVQHALEAARVLRRHDIPRSLRLLEEALLVDAQNTDVIVLAAALQASHGSFEEATRLLQRLPAQEREGGRDAARLTMLYSLSGKYSEALEHWKAHPEAWNTKDPEVLFQVSFAHSAVGDLDEAQRVLSLVKALPNLNTERQWKRLYIQATIHYRRGEYAQQEQLTQEALGLARVDNQPQVIANTLVLRHYALGFLGHLHESLAALTEASGLYALAGDTKGYTFAQILMGDLLILFGRYEHAEELLLESLRHSVQHEQLASVLDCERTLAELYLSWQAPHTKILAFKHAQAALDMARKTNNPLGIMNGLLGLSAAESAQGHGQRALELANEALEMAQTLSSKWAVFACHKRLGDALAQTGQTDEASHAFAKAKTLATELGLVVEEHHLLFELARLHGDVAGLTTQLNFFENQGLEGLAKPVRDCLNKNPAPPSPHPTLRLEVLGPMQCRHNGATTLVRGTKRKGLLAALLEARLAGRPDVSRLQLLDTLYAGVQESQANAALGDMVYQLRELLGEGIVTTTESGYALGAVGSDAEDFLSSGNTRLWRGPCFEGLDTSERLENVQEAIVEALRLRLEALLSGDPPEAVRVGGLLCLTAPYDLDGLRLHLRALQTAGNPRGLARAYAQAKTRFFEIGETLPRNLADFLTANNPNF